MNHSLLYFDTIPEFAECAAKLTQENIYFTGRKEAGQWVIEILGY